MGIAPKLSGDALDFVKFIDESGAMAGVDQQSLVRGMKLNLADSASKGQRMIAEVEHIPQKIGFNMGEQMNQLVHHSATYDRYKRSGQNLADKTVREKAMIEARALSMEMNRAGELGYSHGSAAAILQFLQMPHKAVLQQTNRKLSVSARRRMLLADTVLWGTPAALIGAVIGEATLPEDRDLRELVMDGLVSVLLNKMFTILGGEESKTDFSSLAPSSMDGWIKIWSAAMEEGSINTLLASPAGQLWAKDGGRIQNALSAVSRYLTQSESYDVPPYKLSTALNEVMKITSGWNNMDKARIMFNLRKKIDAKGIVTDSEVTFFEAMWQAAGFGTQDERNLYMASMKVSKLTKARTKELDQMYADVMRWSNQQMTGDVNDIEHLTLTVNMLMEAFGDNPQEAEYIQKKFAKDIRGPHQELMERIMKAAGMPNDKDLLNAVRTSPLPDEEKKQIEDYIQYINSYQNKDK
jgi:hypothetical protein